LDIVKTMRLRTLPSSAIDFCGAFIIVELFTDGIFFPLIRIWKDRSRMARKLRDLWGIIATGDILRFGGILFLMFCHRTILA
jgi:hypothetical protein